MVIKIITFVKRLMCYIRAVGDFFKCGAWIPHVYVDTYKPAIIIATETSFRVADNYEHTPDETVYPNATLIIGCCKYCGNVELSWMNNERKINIFKKI